MHVIENEFLKVDILKSVVVKVIILSRYVCFDETMTINKSRRISLTCLPYCTITSVYTNIPSCRRDDSKTSFPLQEGIFVYSRVFVQ